MSNSVLAIMPNTHDIIYDFPGPDFSTEYPGLLHAPPGLEAAAPPVYRGPGGQERFSCYEVSPSRPVTTVKLPVRKRSNRSGTGTQSPKCKALATRAAERWERWERVPSQFEILAAILADDLRTFVAK